MNTSLDRRRFLGLSAMTAAAIAAGPAVRVGAATSADRSVPDGVFALGVASGDPLHDRVVLWTRLAPDPVAEDGLGAMPDRLVPVQWQVAEDERFERIVREGTEVTDASVGFSVHADPVGLAPDRWYHYRFRAGAHLSPVGRTRTAPAAGGAPFGMLAALQDRILRQVRALRP